jgi:Mg2+ and Co2+ transporter CorA
MKSILPATWNVPEQFRIRLGETAGRQRAMLADGHLLLILHAPPGPDDVERVGRFFWRDDQGQWISNQLGSGVPSIRKHLAEFNDRLETLDDELESAHEARDYFDLLQAIAPIQRTARNLHAALQEAREMIPDERELISLRDLAGAIERTADLLHQEAKNGLDFVTARSAQEQSIRSWEQARSAHRLNIMAAIFLPLATLASVFGMNISHGLESSGFGTFVLVVFVGIGLGIWLASWMMSSREVHRDPMKKSRPSGRDPRVT